MIPKVLYCFHCVYFTVLIFKDVYIKIALKDLGTLALKTFKNKQHQSGENDVPKGIGCERKGLSNTWDP